MRKRFLSFVMTCILLVVPHTVMAANIQDDIVSPQWTYVHSIATTLTPNGYIGGAVTLEGDYDFLLILQLQENDGTGWSTIETWSIEGVLSGGIEDYCDLDSDSDYRAKVTAKVFTDLGRLVETVSIYSDPV